MIEIAGRRIGKGESCFVIAEAGVNHNGELELAHKLVDAAAEAGADAVKFQTWITEELIVADAPLAEYQRRNQHAQSQYEMLKALELDPPAFTELRDHARDAGIVFLSTPDEERSADALEMLAVPAFKIGSAEVTNLPYLRHVARKGRPIILSTGMSELEEVRAAVAAIEEEGNDELVLLHCVSNYPSAPEDSNLRTMDTLRDVFGHPVGFSDHTLGSDVALAAVARGACVLEKHLTVDRSLPGPDHVASTEPEELARLVASVRVVESALGDGVKRPVASEADARATMRKTIVARRRIAAGEMIGAEDLALRRANGGLLPAALPDVLGRRATRAIAADETLALDALE